jgi:hypothetical protein
MARSLTKIRWAATGAGSRHKTARLPQCVTSQATITNTTSVTRTNVT